MDKKTTLKEKFVIVLPNIRSAHNVGAMFRTADGAGVDKIYLTGFTPRPPHPHLDKVSLGAEMWMNWEYIPQTGRLLKQLQKKGYNIVGLEQTKTSKNIFSWKPTFPIALIVGNEKTGLTKTLLKYCAQTIDIKMRGRKNSLNVSVAAGIAMFQIAKIK
ncbi:MAG: RNA methyltransferase [bacterium]|nr:RNA methyltransferase [bacterium]